ncbi:MAG: hypothetical protein P4M05_05040 [Bradyrhizobium sp.]|nr:hypothetical protein [Bradyrhizobium sp.]
MPDENHLAALWPPSESEWRELLQSLPPDADKVAVRLAIEDAVREYVADEKRDQQLHDVWERIAILSTTQKVTEFYRSILKLKDFPLDPDAEALLRHADAFAKTSSKIKSRAAIYLATARKGRLMSRLSLAWTGPGKAKMPISETGPFAEFLCAVTARVSPPGLEGSGVKRFVKRERARRAVLRLLKEHWRGRVDVTIGEDKVYVIDESGQQHTGVGPRSNSRS